MTSTSTSPALVHQRHEPAEPGTPATPAPTAGGHRRDIEGLRAVAVLLVVIYHCGWSWAGGGFVGVDVFFVISGFLITGLLLRESSRTGGVSLPRFYARRAMRLLPAAGVVVVATVVASALWLPPLRLPGILWDALATNAYAMNFRLALVGTDYLNADAEPSPLQHFWSLAVEEQFYFVWPLLIIALGRWRRTLGIVLILLTSASLAVGVWQTRANAGWAYFGPHTRAWELAVGALLALTALRLPRIFAWLGLAAVAAGAVLYTASTPFPGYAALLPVLGTAAVIAGGTGRSAGLLGLAPLQWIGKLSYSWYLWHWPALQLAPHALGRPLSVPENLVVALGALLLALGTYHLVENPARHLRALRDRHWRGLGAGLGISVAAALICASVAYVTPPLRGVPNYQAEQASVDASALATAAALDSAAAADESGLSTQLADSVDPPAVPLNLEPPLDKAINDKPAPYDEGCAGGFTDAEVKKPCAYGDTSSATTVVLFGDSHAGHWFPAMEEIAKEKHWRLVLVTKSSCSAADGLIYAPQLKRSFTECVQWRHDAFGYIRSLRPAKVLLASVYPGNELLDVAGTQDEAYEAAWRTTVQAVSGPGTRVYFMNDTPWQAQSTADCLSEHLDDPAPCSRPRVKAIARPDRRALVEQAVEAEGAKVIDPIPWFCTDTVCPAMVDNIMVFRDQHHITTAYSRLLSPVLATQLD